ncbi:MAG: spermidine synthase, partial [Candidatus Limnocylindria bacterium]
MLPLYALAIFVSAALLFVLEPLFARLVLPVLGGSPAVWNTSLAFYQATLLAGYLYAHLTRHLPMRAQVALHAAVLVGAVAVLPVRLPAGAPAPGQEPVLWLLGALVVGIGLPFFAISATSPLLQRWFSRSGHVRAHDPYFLYAASNAGSLIGLLSYPFLLEPRWRLAEQSLGWSAGFLVLLVLVIASGAVALRRSRAGVEVVPIPVVGGAPDVDPVEVPIPWTRIARWVLLAAVPSSLLIGVTTYLQTDLSPMPLLWVAPLGLYLATFILAFGRPEVAPPTVLARILPFAVLPMAVLLGRSVFQTGLGPSGLFIVLHLLVFTVVALLCHVQLAEDRPPARHLTSFYLWVALGGVVGGSFNAFVAPAVFETVLEYPIALVAASLLAPRLFRGRETRRTRALDLALPAAVGVAVAAFALLARGGVIGGEVAVALMLGIPAVVVFSFSRRPLRFGLGVAALLLASGSLYSEVGTTVAIDRTFFGVHRVVDAEDLGRRYLFHG